VRCPADSDERSVYLTLRAIERTDGIPRFLTRKAIAQGKLEGFRFGDGSILVHREELRRWRRSCAVPPEAQVQERDGARS
jgi:hypothetical protein